MKRLDGKVAIITGGGRGIGEAIATLFAEEGAKVVVADINKDTGNRTVNTIKAAGGESIFVYCDTSNFNDVENLVDAAVTTFGKLDIMVNNAGIYREQPGKCADTTLEAWDRGIAIDLSGVFYGCKCAIPAMLRNGRGSIVNVSSVSGLFGEYGMCWYNAAKGGVSNMTRNIAIDYARQGIRCNAVNPGMTAAGRGTPPRDNPSKIMDDVEWIFPMGRPGTAKEVAYCVLFLASDESAIVNGVNLLCDGGITAHSGQPPFGNVERQSLERTK